MSVADYFDYRGVWEPMLHRNLNDWEICEFLSLMEMLMNNSLAPNRCDGWLWSLNKEGIYMAKSMYSKLVNDCNTSFPHET